MAGSGRISLLVSGELATLVQAVRGLHPELRKQFRRHTKIIAEPVWREAVRGHVTTRLQTRVLSDSSRASVSDSNVMLRSGGIGKTSTGTPNATLAFGTEFGANPDKMVTARSKNGTVYQRRMGNRFKFPRRAGWVVYPAARTVIPRIAKLWVQTGVRTVHEQFEKGGARG